MALFKEEDFGKPISEELSNYLKSFTNSKDVVDASEKTGIGLSTAKQLRVRTNTLTKDNQIVIVELVKTAFNNAMKFNDLNKSIKKKLELCQA